MKLFEFLAPWPPSQVILLYEVDPRIPFYEGSIGRLSFPFIKGRDVQRVEYSMNEILIEVSRGVNRG